MNFVILYWEVRKSFIISTTFYHKREEEKISKEDLFDYFFLSFFFWKKIHDLLQNSYFYGFFFRCICVLFLHGTTPYAQTEYHLNVKKKQQKIKENLFHQLLGSIVATAKQFFSHWFNFWFIAALFFSISNLIYLLVWIQRLFSWRHEEEEGKSFINIIKKWNLRNIG